MYLPTGKRLLDLAVAIPGLVVLSPLMLVVAAPVRARMGAPVLFRQERPCHRVPAVPERYDCR